MIWRWTFRFMWIGAFLICLTLIPLSWVDAAEPTVDEKIESIQKDVNQLKVKEDQLEFLKDETKNFRESVQKERESRYLLLLIYF